MKSLNPKIITDKKVLELGKVELSNPIIPRTPLNSNPGCNTYNSLEELHDEQRRQAGIINPQILKDVILPQESIPVGHSVMSFSPAEDNSKFDITTDYSLTNS